MFGLSKSHFSLFLSCFYICMYISIYISAGLGVVCILFMYSWILGFYSVLLPKCSGR